MTNLSNNTPRVLLIDAGVPNPTYDAGSKAIIDFIDVIRAGSNQHDIDIHFLAMSNTTWGRDTDLIERNVRIHTADEKLLSTRGQSEWLDLVAPDIVVISRPGPASQWLTTVMTRKKAGSGPRFFYCGHDIHHQRLKQQKRFNPQPTLDRQQKLYLALEQTIWQWFSVVIYGSKDECTYVNSIIPNKAVYLPLYLARDNIPSSDLSKRSAADVPSMLWVGGAHHAPNRDGLFWLIREVLPKVAKSVVLEVVGDWPRQVRKQLDSNPIDERHKVHWLGQIEQSSLEGAYQRCAFAIATLRFGAGVKGKVFEAIARKCPVLTTPVGAQGLEHLRWPKLFLSEARVHAVAQRIEELLMINPRQRFANELASMQAALGHDSKMAKKIWASLIHDSGH